MTKFTTTTKSRLTEAGIECAESGKLKLKKIYIQVPVTLGFIVRHHQPTCFERIQLNVLKDLYYSKYKECQAKKLLPNHHHGCNLVRKDLTTNFRPEHG